tara:strand:+ start:1599 stop:2120 length:522 start_codon:yes stop_codon:yes gene_type:complete
MYAVLTKIFWKLVYGFPIIALFILVFTGFDMSFFFYNINFSFKFIYIVIFFWVLKRPHVLGYGFIFFAGLIHDVVQNFPIGISSINFLLLCLIAAFIRTKTLLPSLLYDWILFFVAILIISSVNYSILTIIFEIPIKYPTLMLNSFITFLVYPIFSKIFEMINLLSIRREDAE